MAFVDPTPPKGLKAKGRTGVHISVVKGWGEKTITRIVLRPDVTARLGIQNRDRIKIQIGTGPDTGKLLLFKCPNEGVRGIVNGDQFVLLTPRIPGRAGRFAQVECPTLYTDAGLVITLPPEHGGPAANITPIKSNRA